MQLIKKILLYTIGVFVVIVPLGITFSIGWRPFVGPRVRPLTDRKFEVTAARMERGRYLVDGLMGCLDCHSDRDPSLPGAGPKVGREGAGTLFGTDPALGVLYSSNITPDPETGIGRWTDDQIARAIREGIGGDGRALFPIMPYENFRHMPDDDLAAIVVYIRSIPAVRNPIPKPQINFPVNRLIMSVPEPITDPVRAPDLSTPAARGEYLVRMASCADCHTPQDSHGQRIAGMEFGGGFVLDSPTGKKMAAANITPDASGIPYYDETTFIKAIRTGQVGARTLDPIMPWGVYRNLNDEDLTAMFAFIRQLKPVVHHVDNTVAPTMCPVCGYRHGLGDTNKR